MLTAGYNRDLTISRIESLHMDKPWEKTAQYQNFARIQGIRRNKQLSEEMLT